MPSIEEKDVTILAIESSCDDTSAAVMRGGELLSCVIASQDVHMRYGGVVPELASRAHELNIVPTVRAALDQAGIALREVSAVGVTLGPGLMGSLLVGVSFAKGLALSLGIPLIEANHLQGHVLAHFIRRPGQADFAPPPFPFLCLLVSGGNSQIIRVDSYEQMTILGQTIDDAAGEALDKCAKMLGLGYPGGPIVDRLARQGNPDAFHFSRPHAPVLDFSFSGLKTSILYTLRRELEGDPDFVKKHTADICASAERAVVDVLMTKLDRAVRDTGLRHVALSGGVSANTALRQAFAERQRHQGWHTYLPPLAYTTDNAAMIAIVAHHKYLAGQFCPMDKPAYARTIL